jgi:hypothetical protein
MGKVGLFALLCTSAWTFAPVPAAGVDFSRTGRTIVKHQRRVSVNRVNPIDLSKIDRTILKQPVYQSKSPKYCLLVFGLKAKTRVWLVLDGDVLYVDRNHNGDLTEPNERLFLKEVKHKGIPTYKVCRVGDLTEEDGKTIHRDLRVTLIGFKDGRPEYLAISVKIEGKYLMLTRIELNGAPSSPDRAPIRHFNGPLTVLLYGGAELVRGDEPARLAVVIGTFYLPRQARTKEGHAIPWYVEDCEDVSAFVMPEGVPKHVHAIARIRFPAGKMGEKVTVIEAALSQRGELGAWLGTVRVPKGIRKGKAVVTVSVPRWHGVQVGTTTYEVPVVDPEDLVRRALTRPMTLENGIDKGTPLADAIEYIKDHYDLKIEIDKEACRGARAENMGSRKVGLPPLKKVSISSALSKLLKQAGAEYKIRGRIIYIVPRPGS